MGNKDKKVVLFSKKNQLADIEFYAGAAVEDARKRNRYVRSLGRPGFLEAGLLGG